MNAFTSMDHTTYPFATTNAQDFRNLMSVYLDATLHPLLKEHDYTQEGWRLGPENPAAPPNDPARKIVFKGVVYNEMKGQMSDASYLYYIRFHEHLFPSLNNSGGDPQRMTDLTYEQLKHFHASHYHPSNSKILTYGDLPLQEHLRSIGQELEKFEKIPSDKSVKLPQSLDDGARSVTIQGPVDPFIPQDAQYRTSITWLMGPTSDVVENFSVSLLSSLLLDGYGSPFYRNLIEEGLGLDWTANTGYDGSGRQAVLSIGLNGVKAENVDKVRGAIYSTLQEVKSKGFEKQKVEGILHQLELGLKHKTANFGMSMIQRLKPAWFNGVDVFDALAWQRTVDEFKARYSEDGYLERLLEKYLMTEKTLTFTMEPSTTYAQDLVQEESTRLASKVEEANAKFGGTEATAEHLQKREEELVAQQSAESDTSCLPSVHVQDIPRRKDITKTTDNTVRSTNVQWKTAPTNGLTYFRALSLFKNLPVELRTFVPLFCDAIMRIGTKDKSMESLEDEIKLRTGGVSFGYHSCSSPTSIDGVEEGLSISGFAFDRNIPAMYDIMRALILETDFDSPKAHAMVRELLQSSASGAVDSIAEAGHSYARRFAEAGISPHGRLVEHTGGITQIANMATLASHPDLSSSIAGELIKALKSIQSVISANLANMRVAMTCGVESTDTNSAALERFLDSTFSDQHSSRPQTPQVALRDWSSGITRNTKSFFPLPYQVYYSAHALRTVPYTDPAGASLTVLAQLLTHKHLHREIREKGGAYGGGAYSRALDGVFGFYAYRDPNPENTLRIIDNAGKWALEREWTDQDLEEAKLSVFQGLDAPRSVSEEGMTRFVTGVTPEMEQVRREQLLDVSKSQVRDAAEKFLLQGLKVGNTAVLGEKKAFAEESKGWTIQDLGMGKKGEEVEDVDAVDSGAEGAKAAMTGAALF